MADGDSWDADSFEPDEPIQKAAVTDKWEGEDEEDDIKDNWDDEEEDGEEKPVEKPTEVKSTDKKKLSDKIKEKESLQRQQQEELQKTIEKPSDAPEEVPEEVPEEELAEELAERLHVQKLQEDSDLELANDALGVVSNHVTGIDVINPSSREDFAEFERLLCEKISPHEKSVHYCSFLESLFRSLCLSLEVEDLKKINNSLTALLSEKQRQEKNKGKKKKKVAPPGGGLKAKMKDDLADYGEFDGGYAQDYEDFI